MGEVYRARDPRLNRDIAIKVLPASYSQDPDRLRRFEQEAKAAGVLNHPNITAVYDIGRSETDGSLYVVSELLEGETLRARLAGAPLPLRKALDYARQIASGLAAAHEKGIVHRDLKPENLFITKDGRVKILDFGLAKLTHAEDSSTSASNLPTETKGTEPGIVLGTLGYMSPEQVRGRRADTRSDIFSFGAILYEMLAGNRAFRGDSVADTMSAILKEDPPELSLTNKNISPGLDRIVRHCLEKTPEERFHSARDLAFALREIVDSAPQQAAPPPVARPLPLVRLAALAIAIGLVVLILSNAGGLRDRIAGGAETRHVQSLAVLPLENLSRDPEQEYFADGMTEALITDVSRISALRVISRNSAMRLKGTTKSLPEIGRELHVDAAITGTVLRSGDRVRITTQLIDASTDRSLWAESYERDLRDVIALQRDIARAVATAVRAKLTPEERTQLEGGRAVDPEAHQEYLKGRFHWNKRTTASLHEAIRHFERAIEKEPDYALAYAGIADCYAVLPAISGSLATETLPRANAAARKAIELDESIAEAHVSLAYERLYSWDWKTSEREFQRALDLNPSYATAHFWYAAHLGARGRVDQAIRHAKEGQGLDPISPILSAGVSWMHHLARRFDGEIDWARRALELDPGFPVARWRLGMGLVHRGRFEEAIAAMRGAVDVSEESPETVGMLGYCYALAGSPAEARSVLKRLAELSARRHVSAYHVAIVQTALGEKDAAFAGLERAFVEQSYQLTFSKVEVMLDPLRGDPRLTDLIRRVGAPP